MSSKHAGKYTDLLRRRKNLVIIVSIMVLISIILFFKPLFNTQTTLTTENPMTTTIGRQKRVLIYDPLSREYPNPSLIIELKTLFMKYNYSVDVYIGKNATLDPLYHLGLYDIIILRAHGGFNNDSSIGKPVGPYIFTGIYVDEAVKIYGRNKIDNLFRNNYVVKGVIPREGEPLNNLPIYLVASPLFFKDKIDKLKNDTVIIYTGCYGLDNDVLANIFLSKGAYAYLSFKGSVTWAFGDKVLETIAEKLVRGEDIVEIYMSLNDALKKDPYSDAVLEIRYHK